MDSGQRVNSVIPNELSAFLNWDFYVEKLKAEEPILLIFSTQTGTNNATRITSYCFIRFVVLMFSYLQLPIQNKIE